MKLEEWKCDDCGGVAYFPHDRNVKSPQCPYMFEEDKCVGEIMTPTGKTITFPAERPYGRSYDRGGGKMKTNKKSALPWWFVQLKLYHIVGDLERQDYGSALATAIEIRGDVDKMELKCRDDEADSRAAVSRQFFACLNCGKDPGKEAGR